MPNTSQNCMSKEELTSDFNSRANRVKEIVERLGIGADDLSELNVLLTHMANDQYWLGMIEANQAWKNHVFSFSAA